MRFDLDIFGLMWNTIFIKTIPEVKNEIIRKAGKVKLQLCQNVPENFNKAICGFVRDSLLSDIVFHILILSSIFVKT